MKRTPIRKQSSKARAELQVWLKVKRQRMAQLGEKFGYVLCEYCAKPINSNSELYSAEGHHNDHNRRNNTFENCRILHRVCNQRIEDLNVKDVPDLLKELGA